MSGPHHDAHPAHRLNRLEKQARKRECFAMVDGRKLDGQIIVCESWGLGELSRGPKEPAEPAEHKARQGYRQFLRIRTDDQSKLPLYNTI